MRWPLTNVTFADYLPHCLWLPCALFSCALAISVLHKQHQQQKQQQHHLA
jgi:hypothetical protein